MEATSSLQEHAEPICCPRFDPTPWEEKFFEWKDKLFIKDHVCTLFYMPLNFGKVMKRLDEKVKKSDATIPDGMCLSDHTSKWNMDIYLAIDKDVKATEQTTLNGKFFSKVYEGPFKDTGKWCADFEKVAQSKGLCIWKYYMWYTTCPKCARKYGKNYVVIIAQID